MNNPHQNARTTIYSRELMITRRAEGRPVARIAEEFGVSIRTVWKCLRHHREGGRAALANGASAPARPGNRTARHWVDLLTRLRREYRLTGAKIAEKLNLPRSTVARWLRRLGLGRLKALDPREPPQRCQRHLPGELIHLYVKKFGRFERPGHRITRQRKGCRNAGASWDFVHVAVDDATRLAYAEALPDERRATASGFLVRALRWFRARGVRAERVMSDNGSAYVSRLFANSNAHSALRSGTRRSPADPRYRQGRE